jgi:hypothetical protein
LNTSALYWRYYAATALARYKNPLWTNRVGYVNWVDLYAYVLKDITDLKGEVQLPHMQTTRGGTILEAETATIENAKASSEVKGFTGSGYVIAVDSLSKLTLTYNVMRAGKYIFEFRYVSRWAAGSASSKTSIFNGDAPSSEITFWPSGTHQNWVWDKAEITLPKGRQKVSFMLPEEILLDHINVYGR